MQTAPIRDEMPATARADGLQGPGGGAENSGCRNHDAKSDFVVVADLVLFLHSRNEREAVDAASQVLDVLQIGNEGIWNSNRFHERQFDRRHDVSPPEFLCDLNHTSLAPPISPSNHAPVIFAGSQSESYQKVNRRFPSQIHEAEYQLGGRAA